MSGANGSDRPGERPGSGVGVEAGGHGSGGHGAGGVDGEAVDPLHRLGDFAAFLRANGVPADTGAVLDAHRAAAVGSLRSRVAWRRACRACFCRDRATWQRFDVLFDAFWQPDGLPLDARGTRADGQGDGAAALVGGQRLLGMAGTSEKQREEEEFFGAGDFKALSLADFRFVFDRAQMAEIERLVERVARRARRRVSRRTRPTSSGTRVDLRRSQRALQRHGGQPIELAWRRPDRQLHRFVLLLDISQSMDVYAKLFLRFGRILMTVFRRSHAFAFNTELTLIGEGGARLRERDIEEAINADAKGWLGGTRIAECLERFAEEHLHDLVDSRTTLVIFSDGCDTAKPERLAAAVQPLRRRAGRLIWVNPLLGRFAPGQANRWMDPVVPHVDAYCAAHDLASLVLLERELLR